MRVGTACARGRGTGHMLPFRTASPLLRVCIFVVRVVGEVDHAHRLVQVWPRALEPLEPLGLHLSALFWGDRAEPSGSLGRRRGGRFGLRCSRGGGRLFLRHLYGHLKFPLKACLLVLYLLILIKVNDFGMCGLGSRRVALLQAECNRSDRHYQWIFMPNLSAGEQTS